MLSKDRKYGMRDDKEQIPWTNCNYWNITTVNLGSVLHVVRLVGIKCMI